MSIRRAGICQMCWVVRKNLTEQVKWSKEPEKVKGKSYRYLGGVIQAERPLRAKAWRMDCAWCLKNCKETSEADVERWGRRAGGEVKKGSRVFPGGPVTKTPWGLRSDPRSGN